MAKPPIEVLTGTTVDDETIITIVEICQSCGIHADAIAEMVEHGILEPIGDNPARWCFPGSSLRRATTVVHLQRDLNVNLEGAALALELLDEIRALRRRLHALERGER